MKVLSISEIEKIIVSVFNGTRGYMRMIAFAALLAPFSVAVTSLLSVLIGLFYTDGSITPNSVAEVANSGLSIDRLLSALLLAPVVENTICYFWYVFLGAWKERYWWSKPALIAGIAAFFHAALLSDLRPLAVFPGFFIMAAFIVHSTNKKLGYAASVVHHFFINLISLSLAHWISIS